MADKVTTAPKTIIRAVSPTGAGSAPKVLPPQQVLGSGLTGGGSTPLGKPDKLKAKGIDLGVKAIAGSFGATGQTQANIKNLVLSGGKSKTAKLGLALSAVDKLTGRNFSGLVGKDIFDFLNPIKQPKQLPEGSVTFQSPLETRVGSINAKAELVEAESQRFYKTPSDATNPKSMLVKMRARLDPLLGIDWRITLPSFTSVGFGGNGIVEETFRWYVEDVVVSPRNLAQESVFRRGSQIHYPGWIDTGSLSITFYEDIRMNAYNYIQTWQNRIRDPELGFYYLPSHYKFDIEIDCINRDSKGNEIVIGTFKAIRCWPVTRQSIQLQSASSELVKLTVDFATDGVQFIPSQSSYEALETQFRLRDPEQITPYSPKDSKRGQSLLGYLLDKVGLKKAGAAVSGAADKFRNFQGVLNKKV